jgi:hypothetical protein
LIQEPRSPGHAGDVAVWLVAALDANAMRAIDVQSKRAFEQRHFERIFFERIFIGFSRQGSNRTIFLVDLQARTGSSALMPLQV